MKQKTIKLFVNIVYIVFEKEYTNKSEQLKLYIFCLLISSISKGYKNRKKTLRGKIK